MVEAPRNHLIEHVLAGMAERSMPQVVPQGDRLRQIFIEAEGPGDGSRNLRDFKGMGQPGPIVIACRNEKNLGLMF